MLLSTRWGCIALLALVGCARPVDTIRAQEPVAQKPVEEPVQDQVQVQVQEPVQSQDQVQEPEPVPTPAFERESAPLFDVEFQSLRLKDSTWVRAQPFADAAQLGIISSAARPQYRSHVINEQCPTPWVEIEPHGWICARVVPSQKPKSEPTKKKPKALPGTYGIARKGGAFYKSLDHAERNEVTREVQGDMMQLIQSTTLEDGRVLWRTQVGEWIDAEYVRQLSGSRFSGVHLEGPDAPALPFAFAVDQESKRGRAPISLFGDPDSKARRVGRLKAKTIVAVDEEAANQGFLPLVDEENRWVRRTDLRFVRKVERPEGASGYWVDVDADEQVVVVYRGDTPVFATLASTGRVSDPTPPGVYRVTRKKKRTTMMSDRNEKQTYAVSVPWATYFHEGYAFHAAYWHNSFGKQKSHGCVNLSPADALFVYQLLEPALPAGWLAVYGEESLQPGSLIQVRSTAPPIPEKH